MPAFEIEIHEIITHRRKVIVSAATEDEAKNDASQGLGAFINSDSEVLTNVERQVLTAKPYTGPRYAAERVEGDPDYGDVVDLTTGDRVECGISYQDARDDAENRNKYGLSDDEE